MKKMVSIALIFCLLIVAAFQVYAVSVVTPTGAQPGEDFIVKISNNLITLNGFWPKDANGNPANSLTLGTVVIPATIDGLTVTNLSQCFYYKSTAAQGSTYTLSKATNFIIPDTVQSITSYAFRGQSTLTSIDIPASVTNITGYSFMGTTGLQTVKFLGTTPPTITTGTNATYFSDKAVKVYYPAGATGYTDSAWQAKFYAGTTFEEYTPATPSPAPSVEPSPTPSPVADEITGITLKNASGSTETVADATAVGTVSLTSNNSSAGVLIVGAYDTISGKTYLVAAKEVQVTAASYTDKSATLTLDLNIPNGTDYVKAFFWNSTADIKPLMCSLSK